MKGAKKRACKNTISSYVSFPLQNGTQEMRMFTSGTMIYVSVENQNLTPPGPLPFNTALH